jgi:hypothetical protein
MMRLDQRPLGFLAVRMLLALLLPAVLAWAGLHWTDWADLPAAENRVSFEVRRARNLEEQLRAARDRHAAKLRLTREVIEGQLPLLEAAARFQDLDRTLPGVPRAQFRESYSGGSDDERYCRQVIAFVRVSLWFDRPGGSTEVVDRLEAELRQHLARGDLRLPELAAGER